MDHRLVAWARAVKARQRSRFPTMWLFTDPTRLPDPIAAIATLPIGEAGVVFRPNHDLDQTLLLLRITRLCRARRLVLSVAEPVCDLPAGAGRHLRRGVGATAAWCTSSAHGRAELLRARRRGAALAFLSPAFPTASHPGAPALGPIRWGLASRDCGMPVLALGGVTGRNVRRLPRWVAGVGAIGGLVP